VKKKKKFGYQRFLVDLADFLVFLFGGVGGITSSSSSELEITAGLVVRVLRRGGEGVVCSPPSSSTLETTTDLVDRILRRGGEGGVRSPSSTGTLSSSTLETTADLVDRVLRRGGEGGGVVRSSATTETLRGACRRVLEGTVFSLFVVELNERKFDENNT
jgi:hypothetical protein